MESYVRKAAKWDDLLRTTVRRLMAIEDTAGLVARVAMLGGMSKQDMLFLHRQNICKCERCDCQLLHVIDADIGITMLFAKPSDSYVKYYLGVLPEKLWRSFRSLRDFGIGDIRISNTVSNVTCGVEFDELKEIYYCVILNGLEKSEAGFLIDPSVIQTFGLIWDEANSIAKNTSKAWERLGFRLPCG